MDAVSALLNVPCPEHRPTGTPDDCAVCGTPVAVYAELERLRAAPSVDQARGAVGWLLDYYGRPRSPWSAEEDQTDAARRVLGGELVETLIAAVSRGVGGAP